MTRRLAVASSAVLLVLAGPAVAHPEAAAPPIHVSAAGSCPDAEQVQLELRRTVNAVALQPEVPGHRAAVTEEPGGLRIQLRGAHAEVLGDRLIATVADCGERATVAAAVIGAWEARLQPEVKLDLDLGPAPPRAPSPLRGALSLVALGAASAADSWAPGAALEGTLLHDAGWGGRVTAWGTAFRHQPLGDGPGSARWTRWAAALGPIYETSGERGVASLFAQVAVGQMRLAGEGFPVSHRDTAIDWGLRAGLEAGLRFGVLVPVAGVGVAYWPRPREATVTGSPEVGTLPSMDLLISAGLRWELGARRERRAR